MDKKRIVAILILVALTFGIFFSVRIYNLHNRYPYTDYVLRLCFTEYKPVTAYYLWGPLERKKFSNSCHVPDGWIINITDIFTLLFSQNSIKSM